jgi:hypothetical protein
MPKLEAPRRTKRQASDGRAIPKTRLMVAMPADAVARPSCGTMFVGFMAPFACSHLAKSMRVGANIARALNTPAPQRAVNEIAHGLVIVIRFDRIAAADDAAFLDPAIEARSIIQRQLDRQAEKFLEILAGKIKSPSKEDGGAYS